MSHQELVHLYDVQAWREFKLAKDEQVFEWTNPLSELKKENKKQYDFLTQVQMCETPIKFFSSAIRTLETEVKGSEFSITLGIYQDGAIVPAIIAPEMSYKFCQYLKAIVPKTDDRVKPCYNDLVKMTAQKRDKYLIEHAGKIDVPLTIMTNKNADVGGLGSGIAQGIYSIPIIEELERIIYDTFSKEDLEVKYEFLGYKNGLRVTYTLTESITLPEPIGTVRGYFTIMTRNDFHTALQGNIGILTDRCLNTLLIGGGSGDFWFKDVGDKLPKKDTSFWISHKTPFETVKEDLKEKLPQMVKALKFAPTLLSNTTTEKISLKEAELFLEDMRKLPLGSGLNIYVRLFESLKKRNERQGFLTLYDLIEKLTECSSDNSPIAKNAKWNRHLNNIRFKAGQALTMEMFESECKAMKELQESRTKKEREAKRKAEEKRKEVAERDQIMKDLKIKTVKDYKEAKKRWDKFDYTSEESTYFVQKYQESIDNTDKKKRGRKKSEPALVEIADQ